MMFLVVYVLLHNLYVPISMHGRPSVLNKACFFVLNIFFHIKKVLWFKYFHMCKLQKKVQT